jgi:adenylate cyclase
LTVDGEGSLIESRYTMESVGTRSERATATRNRRVESSLSRPEAAEVLVALERILSNGDFDGSPRSRAFLRFVVEETLAGRQEALTQDAIASRVFHRRDDFDATIDPIVRIQAGRLRRSLERYYLMAGIGDAVRIELPRGSYVPMLRRAAPAESLSPGNPALAVDDWPCVVLLPVETEPVNPDLGPLAARFRDQLVLELGRYRDVRVVVTSDGEREGSSSHEYELSARLARDPSGCWVTSLLADRGTGAQVWAQSFRGEPDVSDRFFEETARVVAARVASEHGVVAQRLWVEQRKRPSVEPTAYGAILRSYNFFFNREAAGLVPAVEALKGVVKAEPECGLAWVQLSRLYTANIANEYLAIDTPVEQALHYARQGVRLDATSQRARGALAYALLLNGELAACRAEAQNALDLNPDSLVYLESIGWLMTLAGDWERGPALVRKAVERNPHCMPVAFHALWADHLRRDELEAAYQAAQQYSEAVFWRPLMRACCLGLLERPSEAAREVAELLVIKPDFARRGLTLIGRLVKLPDLLDRVVCGLAKVGVALD